MNQEYFFGFERPTPVARQAYLDQHPTLHLKLRNIWSKSVDFVNQYPNESFKVMSAFVSIPQQELSAQFQKLRLIKEVDPQIIVEKISDIHAVYKAFGMLQHSVSAKDIVAL